MVKKYYKTKLCTIYFQLPTHVTDFHQKLILVDTGHRASFIVCTLNLYIFLYLFLSIIINYRLSVYLLYKSQVQVVCICITSG